MNDYDQESEGPRFTITKAVRKSVPSLIALWGPSSAGKTYSALHIARGLVGPKGKIGLLDTENRRAEFYADLAGGFEHLDLQPPFTPDRYTTAFKAFESAGGFGCVIVDSMSHVWGGEGGVLDWANKTGGGGLQKWQAPKMAYQRMVNSLLRAPYHVIFCLRAKDGVKQVGKGKDATIESVGAQPICGKGFLYEMTVSTLLGPDHCPAFQGEGALIKCDPLIPALKAPEEIRGIFKQGEPLGIDTGKRIAQWVAGAAVFDIDQAQLERIARDVATMGSDRAREHWSKLTKAEQKALAPIKDELKAIAAEADAANENHEPDQLGATGTDGGTL